MSPCTYTVHYQMVASKSKSYLFLYKPALGAGLPLAMDVPQVRGQQPLVRQHEAALGALVPLQVEVNLNIK